MLKQLRVTHPRRPGATTILVTAVLLLGTDFALAQAQPEGQGGWQYEVTPYLWATRMKGDIKAGPLPKTSLDMKFSDILKTLDFGLMTAVEARKGPWGILLDGMYMKVSDSATATRDDLGLSVSGSLRIQQSMLAGAVAYRVIEDRTPLDVVGGLRYNRIDADAKIDGALYSTSGMVKRSGDKDWIDPYLGLRIHVPINDKWTSVGYVDVGGFGAGSDFTWQGLAGLKYAYSKDVTANFGYRYMKIDYDKDGFRYDMANDGIYVGVGIRF